MFAFPTSRNGAAGGPWPGDWLGAAIVELVVRTLSEVGVAKAAPLLHRQSIVDLANPGLSWASHSEAGRGAWQSCLVST